MTTYLEIVHDSRMTEKDIGTQNKFEPPAHTYLPLDAQSSLNPRSTRAEMLRRVRRQAIQNTHSVKDDAYDLETEERENNSGLILTDSNPEFNIGSIYKKRETRPSETAQHSRQEVMAAAKTVLDGIEERFGAHIPELEKAALIKAVRDGFNAWFIDPKRATKPVYNFIYDQIQFLPDSLKKNRQATSTILRHISLKIDNISSNLFAEEDDKVVRSWLGIETPAIEKHTNTYDSEQPVNTPTQVRPSIVDIRTQPKIAQELGSISERNAKVQAERQRLYQLSADLIRELGSSGITLSVDYTLRIQQAMSRAVTQWNIRGLNRDPRSLEMFIKEQIIEKPTSIADDISNILLTILARRSNDRSSKITSNERKLLEQKFGPEAQVSEARTRVIKILDNLINQINK